MLGVSFIWNHHSLIGVILFAVTIFADTGLSSVRKDFTRMSVKLLFLLYGILLWFIFVTPSNVQRNKLSNADTTLYARTRNITPRKTRSQQKYPLKHSEELKVVKSGRLDKLSGDTIVAEPRNVQKPIAINSLKRKVSSAEVHSRSISLLAKVFGDLPRSDFADLKYRGSEEVKAQLERVFSEMPPDGFLPSIKNPCWKYNMDMNPDIPRTLEDLFNGEGEEQLSLACLPFAYVLGQPKCGTSDLFERLKSHPDIRSHKNHIVLNFFITLSNFTSFHFVSFSFILFHFISFYFIPFNPILSFSILFLFFYLIMIPSYWVFNVPLIFLLYYDPILLGLQCSFNLSTLSWSHLTGSLMFL